VKRWIEAAAVSAIGLAFGLGAEARSELAHARTAEPVAFWFAVALTVLAVMLTGILVWAERVASDDEVPLPRAIARRAWHTARLDARRRAS
jgi:hypothetical protein